MNYFVDGLNKIKIVAITYLKLKVVDKIITVIIFYDLDNYIIIILIKVLGNLNVIIMQIQWQNLLIIKCCRCDS